MWHAHLNKHYGRYLKFLTRYLEEKPVKEVEERCIEVAKKLGWEHYARHINASIPTRYPKTYKPF